MANVFFVASTTTETAAYNSGAAKTLIQLAAPANQRVKITGWEISFDGTSVTAEPVLCRLERQTGGTFSGSTTCVDLLGNSITPNTTAGITVSAEPTGGNILEIFNVHPQSGFAKNYPYGQEPQIPGGGKVGFVVVAPAAVNALVKIYCEE